MIPKAFFISIPSSITVVEIRIGQVPSLNLANISIFSLLPIFPCKYAILSLYLSLYFSYISSTDFVFFNVDSILGQTMKTCLLFIKQNSIKPTIFGESSSQTIVVTSLLFPGKEDKEETSKSP